MSHAGDIAERLAAAGLASDFCPMPWIHVYADPLGDIRPCCWYAGKLGGEPNLSDFADMDQVVNAPAMVALRAAFIDGQNDEGCDSCRRHESFDRFSKRQRAIDSMTDEELMWIAQHPDAHLSEWQMRHFDFRFDNTCNLKCRSCNSINSSRIAAEERLRGMDVHEPRFDAKLWFERFKDQIGTARSIYLAGGEPFMMPQTYDLLRHLINIGMTDVSISINSNMTQLCYKDENIADLLRYFTDVTLGMSLDHYGDKASYLRHGSDWQQILRNHVIMRKHAPNVKIHIDCVVSALNVLDITDIVDHFHSHFHGCDVNLTLAMGKPYLYLNNLPDGIKSTAVGRIQHWLTLHDDSRLYGAMQDLIQRLSEPADPKREGSLLYQMSLIDVVRHENMSEVLPELYVGLRP